MVTSAPNELQTLANSTPITPPPRPITRSGTSVRASACSLVMMRPPISRPGRATEYKGVPFIEECAHQGAHVILITSEEAAGKPWPWDKIERHFNMPDLHTQPNITYAVSYLARGNDIDRIVALDDYDVATAATLREHLRLPGLGETKARYFRDKLGMRTQAAANGIRVPAFTPVFNYDRLRDYRAQVSPPWVLKPRFEAGAIGIRKLYDSEAVWRSLDQIPVLSLCRAGGS